MGMEMDAAAVDASSARRRLVTRADGCVVLLESTASTTDASAALRVRELRVDAADRLMSVADHGDPLPIPNGATLVAATEIVDVELAMLTTVVVLQVATASTDHTRPAKRLRLQTTPSRGSSSLLFFSLWRDDHQRWRLDSFGDACPLPHGVDAVDVRLLDGPLAVVTQRSPASEAPPLLLVSCRQPAAVATIDTGNDRFLSLVSCQLMDDRHSDAGRHLLLQLEEAREFMRLDDRRWGLVRLPPASDALPLTLRLETCSYLPRLPIDHERITACCVLPPPASPVATDRNDYDSRRLSANKEIHDQRPRPLALRLSSVIVVGTSSNTLYVFSNDVLCASFVVDAPPRDISLLVAPSHATGAGLLAVHCSNTERSLFIFSVAPAASPLHCDTLSLSQQFTHVGSFVVWPEIVLDGAEDGRVVLLNHAIANDTVDDDQFLDQLLKKSVILQATERRDSTADAAVSVMQTTCHRLRFRSSRKRRSASTATPFQPIERVKLASRRRDRADSDATTSSQLPRLVRSLEERLRVGQQQLSRLELLARDKSQSLRALSSLLELLDSGGDTTTDNVHDDEELVSLVSVLQLHEAPPHAETNVARTETRAATQATDALSLEMASCDIVAADPETSMFRCVVQLVPSLPVAPHALRGLALSLVPTGSALIPSRCRSWRVDASAVHSRVLNVVVDLELMGWTLRSSVDLCGWIHTSHSARPPQHVGTIRVAPPRALWELPSLGASLTGAPAHDALLLVSAGSSLPASLLTQQRTAALATTLVRPRFAVVRAPSSALVHSVRQHLVWTLKRSLPHDVVAVPNPLEHAHIELLRRLLVSLHDEAQQRITSEDSRAAQVATDLLVRELLVRMRARAQFLIDTRPLDA